MKNIQVIDGAENCVYDIFSVTRQEYELIFSQGTDVAFIDDVYDRENKNILDNMFTKIWKRRVVKKDAMGIHGVLYYELSEKKQYYPDYTDEGAKNPDGTRLR